ncbi:NDP-sugar synthase [soil metagenome]
MQAFVLAAGLGTRLRPLTDELAKPLVPVGDGPLLDHIVRALRSAGATRVVANAHFRAADVIAYGAAHDVSVAHEIELRGTAGGLTHAASLLEGDSVLLYNGDIYAPKLDLAALVALGVDWPAAIGVLAVRPRARGEGNVGMRDDGTIVRLRRQSFADETRGGEFLGIHLLAPALRRALPESGGLIEDGYLPAMARGAVVRAFCTDVPFFDVGTLEGYAAANAAWLRGRNLASWVHPTASAEGELDGSIIGERAIVSGAGALTRCIVWPGARAVAPLADHVVTKSAIVAVQGSRDSVTLRG